MKEWSFRYRGIEVSGNEKIYKPGEDTILLLSNLDKIDINGYDLNIDFGCGSGIVSLTIADMRLYTVSIDIDHDSCLYTLKNSQKMGLEGYIDVVCTSYYLDIFRNDVSIFIASNPPYLPVEEGSYESIAWSGGEGGLEVIRKLLYSLDRYKTFKLYLITSSYTDINLLNRTVIDMNMKMELLDKLEFPDEEINLYAIFR